MDKLCYRYVREIEGGNRREQQYVIVSTPDSKLLIAYLFKNNQYTQLFDEVLI